MTLRCRCLSHLLQVQTPDPPTPALRPMCTQLGTRRHLQLCVLPNSLSCGQGQRQYSHHHHHQPPPGDSRGFLTQVSPWPLLLLWPLKARPQDRVLSLTRCVCSRLSSFPATPSPRVLSSLHQHPSLPGPPTPVQHFSSSVSHAAGRVTN